MAIDRTRTVTLTTVPIEIVATLGLAPGEYRIENDIPDDSSIQSSGIIEFVAWDGPLPNPYTGATHTLRQGAREDIGIERGQKWYFWANRDGVDLTLTAAKAGGAIGGTPPQIRLPSFHVDIFKVFDSVGDIPDTAPVGGVYNLETAQLTPPDTWFESQQRLQSGQVEAHSRAIIDPNIDDPAVFTVDPVWSVPQQVNLIGTITGISTAPPLQGSGDAGRVVLGVQERGIYNRYLASNSIDLRTLDVGTADTYLGYDSSGNPAEITPRTMISEFDVPTYEEDKVLGVATGGTLEWTDQPTVPRDVEFFYGHVAPTNPEGENDIWFVDENASNIAMTYESDATTPRTNILKGDIYEWLPLTTTGSGWVYQANLDSAYTVVTDTTDGIMTHLDKIKLDSIAAGAERNVQADWDVSNTTNDSYIQNKPDIPDAQIPADWNQTTTTAADFIKNKPTVLSDFDAPPYTNNDGRALGLVSGVLAWIDLGSFRLTFGTDFPANPATGNHFIFTGDVSSGLTGYTEIDTTTSRTSALVGDVATHNGSVWVYSGSINTRYSEATRTVSGLMSSDDKTKLDGIQVGAEANEKADWNENNSNSDAFIQNKPTIPDAQQPSDWDASSGVTRILNKPTIHPAQIPSDWNQTDTDSLDYIKNKPTVASNIPDAPAAGSDNAVYELAVSSAGAYTWTTAFVPGVPTTSIGSSFPTNPAINDIHFQTANVTTNIPTNVRMSDGTTQQTALAVGEVYQFETEGTGTDQVWTLEGNLNTTYPHSSASADGIMSIAQFNKLAGIAAGAQVNVKSNWDETDTASDSYIQNKPDSITDLDVPVFEATDAGKVLRVDTDGDLEWETEPVPNIPVLTVGETFPVATQDSTHPIEGDIHIPTENVTSETDIPDNVKDEDGTAKVDFIALGDVFKYDGTDWLYQGNIDTRYDEATEDNPGLMSAADKAKLDTIEESAEPNTQADWAQSSSSAESYIRNKPTLPVIPGNATGNTAGLMSASDKTKLDDIASNAEVNVQSSWTETDTSSDAYIIDKPDIVVPPTHIPDAPAEESEQKRYELVVRQSGSSHNYSSWEEAVDSGDDNVQPDWDETDTDSDAYIQNKPSDADFGEKAFHNAPRDLTPAEKAILQGHIGLGENQIGEIAFRNPPDDLTDTDKDEVVSAIGAASSFDTSKLLPTFPAEGSRDDKVLKFDGNTLDWEPESGSGTNTGEANVQSNWDETDTDSDAYIQNKPSDSEIGDKAFSNPPTDLTDDEKTAVRTAIGSGTGSGGLSTVSTDATITGDGSSGSPLSIANPFTDADETKLDGIAAGAEVNVNPDWDETDTDSDAFIQNKPNLLGRYLGDHEIRTAYTKGDVVFSTGQFWRARQDVPDNRTGAPTNELDYWQQVSFSVGMAASLPVFTDNDEFDLNRDRWIILTADQTVTGTRDGSGALPYVADLQDTRSTSDVTSNQLTSLNRGDILRVDTWPTRYWARMVKAAPNLPGHPTAQNSDRDYNLRVTSAGVVSWQQDSGGGGTNTGEENVQSNWTETDTASDAYIQNKPTLVTAFTGLSDTPTALGTAGQVVKVNTGATALEFADESTGGLATVSTDTTITGDGSTASPLSVANPFTDDDETKLDGIASGAEVNPTDTEIGDKAFSNPPNDLTDTEKSAVRSAIGAGTGSGTGGLSTVSTDATITGDGTSGTPLSVANPFTDADETKLDGIATGAEVNPGNATDTTAGLMSGLDKAKLDTIAANAEVNAQANWDTTNTTNDSYIQNKPTDAEFGDKAFSNPPTDLTDTEKTAVRNAIGAGTGSGSAVDEDRLLPTLPATGSRDNKVPKFDGNTLGWEVDAGGAGSGDENVQSNWDETDTASDAYIQNKPTVPDLPTKPANPSAETQYNLQLTTAGVASWESASAGTEVTRTLRATSSTLPTATVGTAPTLGDQLAGITWTLATGAHDAGWREEMNVTMFADAGGRERLALGVEVDLLVDGNIVDRGFVTEGPNSDLPLRTTTTGTNATGILVQVRPDADLIFRSQSGRRAIVLAGLSAPIQANASVRVYEISITRFGSSTSGAGATTFEDLTDTPASLGNAGQFVRVNSAGTGLEFATAPTGGGSSRYLPSADDRETTSSFLYLGWQDNFANSWGIRRIALASGDSTTATITNNSSITRYTDAWSGRVTLTYA